VTRVVMVDDEEHLIWSLDRQLARTRPDLVFEGFTDPGRALASLERSAPDVLVTDVRMPGMTGLELLMAARKSQPALPVVVVTAHGSALVRAEVDRGPAMEYLEKPFTSQALLEAVDRLVASRDRAGFSGEVSLPMLPDLIQLYSLAGATGALVIRRGGVEGALWLDRGEVVHAECGALAGADAFFALLSWRGGTFDMVPGRVAPRRTIDMSCQELLMEGCRRLDEAGRASEPASADPLAVARRVVRQVRDGAGSLLALGVRLDTSEVEVLDGPPLAREQPWAAVLRGLIADVRRLTGAMGAGSIEYLNAELGVALTWMDGDSVAVLLGDGVGGKAGPSRFRSNAARMAAACRETAAVPPKD
jgi:CheY-like chemotaxis protein